MAEFSVADGGSGIPEEVAKKLFTPFFTTPEGMGLGLSMCRTVVEQHGGYFRVRAERAAWYGIHFHPAGQNMTFPARAALAFEWA